MAKRVQVLIGLLIIFYGLSMSGCAPVMTRAGVLIAGVSVLAVPLIFRKLKNHQVDPEND